jgi:predicted nucleic acid-binding protein
MPHLVDTNILLRSAQPAHPMHATATRAVRTLLARGDDMAFLPQNAREFWNVCTRPLASNGLGLSTAQADAELSRISAALTFLPDDPAVFPEWRRLVVTYAVQGVQVHDAHLVASMLVHGATRILTFNTGDFARYAAEGITAVDPATVGSP